MREDLIGLEESTVFFRATVNTWTKSESSSDDFLLKPVRLWPWDGNAPVGTGESIRLDHLWLRCPKDQRSESLERLTDVVGVATVQNYFRSDGSRDYGILHTKPVCNIDNMLINEMTAVHDVPAGLERDEATAAAVSRILEKAEQGLSGEMFVFSRQYSLNDFRDNCSRALLYWERCVEATRSRLATCQQFGKPKGLDLKMPKCRRRPVAAFG
ncbi:hypothetical protein N8654_04860 [Synechococcus sp. AH-601-B19]|nr:hypothetical protein [Synechococcus sp. AH-601-B19]